MKNYSKLAMVFFAAAAMTISTSAWAGTENNNTTAELRFVGTLNALPSFQLALNNAAAGEFLVVVRNADKEILFSEKLKGENISRLYKLDSKSFDLIDGTTFEVTDLATNKTSTFKVNKIVKEVVDVTVSK